MSNTNYMVAHLWANQSKPEARSSNGHFRFRGDTIYSYATPIARMIRNEDGTVRAVLRTSRQYSATTSSKHEPAISSALKAGIPQMRVPSILPTDHVTNMAYLEQQISETFQKACRSVKWTHDAFYRVHTAVADANLYRIIFQQPGNTFTLPPDFEAKRAERMAYIDKLEHPDPTSADRRERERAARQQRKAEQEARERQLRLEMAREAVDGWRAGTLLWLSSGYNLPVMLRLKPGNPYRVQTSLGAEVPLKDAIRIFELARRCHNKKEGLPTHVVQQMLFEHRKVGDFMLDCIDSDGTIHAGCHTIDYEEAERFACQIGVLKDGEFWRSNNQTSDEGYGVAWHA